MIRALFLSLTLALVTAANPTQAAIVSGFDSSNLAANDDGSTDFVAFGIGPINFYGTNYLGAYLNNNGNLTFDFAESAFTPFGLTGALGNPIIAPFFADVDTTGAGSGLLEYGTGTFDGHAAFGVTWEGVGYFASNVDKLNSFQVLIVDRADTGVGNFDIVFNYDQILWETGDFSGGSGGLGGSSAVAGYSNGSGDAGTNFELPGSAVNGAFIDGGPNSLASNSLNSDVDGRYIFAVREGLPDSGTVPEPVSLCIWGGIGIAGLVAGWRRKRSQTSKLAA